MKTHFQVRHFVAALALTAVLSSTASAQKPATKPVAKAKPVKAQPIAKATKSTQKVASAAPTVRPLSVTVDLISKDRLEGTLTDKTSLDMQTSFGGASIPLSEVAGIRFASAENASTTVVMLNGDSITGATDVKLITVETEWGTASIHGQNISSILFVPGLSWNPATGLSGKRWDLINTKKQAAPPRSTAPRSTSTRSTTIQSGRPTPLPSNSFQNGNFRSGQVFPRN